jgi:hypothetical protein
MIRSLSLLCCGTAFVTALSSIVAFAQDTPATTEKPAASPSKPSDADAKEGWKSLLPKDGIEGWEVTNFGGEGDVENKAGSLMLGRGEPLTGITRLGKDFPLENYELRWSAQRADGSDFFAGVTFPVGKEHCSFICGGWGGGLVGISSINGNDASENETASYRNFKNGEWYQFKIRVDAKNITVWINDEQILEIERENRKFSVRAEVMRSRPLGYCVFQSKVLIKDWEYRTVQP